MRRPRAEDVSIAMSDAETALVAVGGMKEVEELILRAL